MVKQKKRSQMINLQTQKTMKDLVKLENIFLSKRKVKGK